MPDIYELLAKHFSEETNAKEEKSIESFKVSNQEEYNILKKLWVTDGLNVIDFDKQKAWQKLKASKTTKVRRIHFSIRKIAAVALVLFASLFVIQYYTGHQDNTFVELKADKKKQIIELEDGSTIHLNKGASLSYPKVFDGENRLVSLKGEAYFDIARDEQRPFKIKTEHSEVRVLGTSFNINTNQDSTMVSVTSGKVQVKSYSNSQEVVLTKKQSVNVTIEGLRTSTNENENFLSWKTGEFSFTDANIGQIVSRLNSYYDNKIQLNSPHPECQLSATFNKNSLEEILEIITLTCPLKLTENNGFYTLK